ncbi:MAG TPA: MaoC family dehydratase [Candidatus Eisenbacteria bacterium]|nr:MaoC family dehydratase [Candidatus Eisenbacteria bacterium]
MTKRYWEDFIVGEALALGATQPVTEEAIIAFARQYDPQYFHVDPARAKESIFGGLVASGWHTASMVMRLWVDAIVSKTVSMGSPGVEDLRWPAPVRPGDTLTSRAVVLETRPSKSRPEMGLVRWRAETSNQREELVFTMTGTSFIGRRPSS